MAGLALRLPPVPTAPAKARHALAAWLGERAATPEGEDALLVVSELVTNGVVHNGGDEIVVRADDHGGGVDIGVTSTPLPGPGAFGRRDGDGDGGGRAMAIVAAICGHVHVHNDERGRRVVSCGLTLG